MPRASRSKRRRAAAFAEFSRRAAPPAAGRHETDDVPPGPDPAARGATVGRARVVSSGANMRLERAIQRFNTSAESRTVAGLIRSLGIPLVSVGTAAGAANEIRITVAWELSWYQWGVDLRDESQPVFAVSKGREIVELDSAARHWNASATESGRLGLGSLG